MSDRLLYIISFLIPALFVPLVLPAIAFVAHQINMTDKPNFRKRQKRPVALMGGMVVVAVICFALVCLNIFVDLDELFPAICVIVILFVIGMVDDAIDLPFSIKLFAQILIIMLLFFAGSYRASDFGGLFGIGKLNLAASLLVSIFLGLYYINAINFIDGIDGLASAFGCFSSFLIAFWCVRHNCTEHAVLSLVFAGALFTFFFFNVFSDRYKMYMGDSGSLVLGMFVYMSVCMEPSQYAPGDFLADHYVFSFPMAVYSAALFDMARVCLWRVLRKKSPFHADRTHMHHCYVDMGFPHFTATMIIVLSNAFVVLVWYLTARSGMSVLLQFCIVFLAGFIFICLPYMIFSLIRKYYPAKYDSLLKNVANYALISAKFRSFMTSIVDGTFKINKYLR